jgi:hypothetical protein
MGLCPGGCLSNRRRYPWVEVERRDREAAPLGGHGQMQCKRGIPRASL